MSYIVFLYEDQLYHSKAEMPGTFVIGSNKKDDMVVSALGQGEVRIKENKKGIVSLECSKFVEFEDQDLKKDAMVVISVDHRSAIYYSDDYQEDCARLKLPYNCSITFGRNEDNNVIIPNGFVGRKHFLLTCENGVVHVEDLKSANGLFLNGKKISKAKLQSGDILSIFHINIRLLNGELIFDNVGPKLRRTSGATWTACARPTTRMSTRLSRDLIL